MTEVYVVELLTYLPSGNVEGEVIGAFDDYTDALNAGADNDPSEVKVTCWHGVDLQWSVLASEVER